MKWCSQVFDNPLPIVCDLISETLASIELQTHITKHLENKQSSLTALIELKQVKHHYIFCKVPNIRCGVIFTIFAIYW